MIYLGCDHGGFALKEKLREWLQDSGRAVTDCGSHAYDEQDNFTDFVRPVVDGVLKDKANVGVLVCGSGIGMSIAANHYRGIRAALVHNVDYARLAREHNHANVLCLGGRFLEFVDAQQILAEFLSTAPNPNPKYWARMQIADGSKDGGK